MNEKENKILTIQLILDETEHLITDAINNDMVGILGPYDLILNCLQAQINRDVEYQSVLDELQGVLFVDKPALDNVVPFKKE